MSVLYRWSQEASVCACSWWLVWHSQWQPSSSFKRAIARDAASCLSRSNRFRWTPVTDRQTKRWTDKHIILVPVKVSGTYRIMKHPIWETTRLPQTSPPPSMIINVDKMDSTHLPINKQLMHTHFHLYMFVHPYSLCTVSSHISY